MTRRIVMLGTAPWTTRPGGIRAVVDIYARNGLFDRWPIEFIGTHVAGGVREKSARAFLAYLRLLVLLVGGQVGLVHAHTASGASFWRKGLFAVTARAFGRPVLLHLHGGGFEAFYRRQPAALRAAIRWVLGRVTQIVVLTPRWHAFVVGLVPDVPVTILPNPVEVPPVAASAAEAPTLLFIGRVERAKGVYELFDAIGSLRRRHPDLTAILAGQVSLEVARYVEAHGLGDVVRLPGWVDRAGKARLFALARVFVLPSHAEGLPISVLEAMAARVPVVATRVGGVPDIIADGEDGVLVPPCDPVSLAEAIDELLRDGTRRERLASAGRDKVVRDYAVEKVLVRLGALYATAGVSCNQSRAYV